MDQMLDYTGLPSLAYVALLLLLVAWTYVVVASPHAENQIAGKRALILAGKPISSCCCKTSVE